MLTVLALPINGNTGKKTCGKEIDVTKKPGVISGSIVMDWLGYISRCFTKHPPKM